MLNVIDYITESTDFTSWWSNEVFAYLYFIEKFFCLYRL